jgi:peptide/nickel transport system permease protein
MAATDRIAAAAGGKSPWREGWVVFRRNRAALLGLSLLALIILATAFGPYVYRVDPFELVGAPFMRPGEDGLLLGTDSLGRDLLAGLLVGGRPTIVVGLAAAAIATVIGISIGSLAGYFGGGVEAVLMRVTEFFQVLPALLFAMVLITLFGASLPVVAMAIGVVAWTGIARLTRAEFLRIKKLDFVRAARAAGATNGRLILRTMLPNALPPVIAAATLAAGTAILFESGLSFLGLSNRNIMSWGLMIGAGRPYLREAWWLVTFPGAAIFVTVLSLSLVGDGLNDAFNPKLRLR